MNLTNYFETKFLNTLRGSAFAAPAKVYIGLFLSSPGETGTAGTEVSYAGYLRQEIVFSAPASGGGGLSIKNTAQINFPTTSAAGGTAAHVAIFDAQTGGNALAYGAMTEPIVIGAGEAPVILSGDCEIASSGNLSAAWREKLLNVFRGVTIAAVSPVIALFGGDPDGAGAELSGENYARVAVPFGAPEEADTGGQATIASTADVSFARPSTDWGNWSHTAICADTAEPIYIIAEAVPAAVKRGYMPIYPAGAIKLAVN